MFRPIPPYYARLRAHPGDRRFVLTPYGVSWRWRGWLHLIVWRCSPWWGRR